MATFGSFETDREVYSGSNYVVYSARKTGDPETNYAVKVFSVHRNRLDAESAAELETLLSDIEGACVARIAVQQQAAAASKYVTPIIETGRDEQGVWYVTRFYHRSVNKIISGSVALERDFLEHIIRSIGQGALDMKRICGRSHGDIQPSNVQISRSEKLVEAEVILSDPLPGAQAEAGRYELSDLRSIGRILLQLVSLPKKLEEKDFLILPILPSPQWTRLFGRDTERWLTLCNRLLDPNLSLERFTLDQLVEELSQLRSQPPVSRGTIIAVAAVVLGLGVTTVLAMMYFKRGNLLITTDPPGAEIKLEGQGESRSGKTPLTIKSLPKGNYKLRAEYPGLLEQTGEVTVAGGKTRSNHVAFAYGWVRITSNPANAEVKLDDKVVVGFTPYTSPFLAPTQQNYSLRLSNHKPAKVVAVVTANRQMVSVHTNLTELEAGTAVVEFTSRPDHVKISENGVELCTTPARIILQVHRHTITAQFEDWPPVTRDIGVVQGDNPVTDMYLPHGEASFSITPSEAEIFLNDRAIGRRVRVPLRPANYTARVTQEGFYSYTNLITITEGTNTTFTASLIPMRGIVVFTTDPPGAGIFDAQAPERELGRTGPGQPLKISFTDGSYSFIAKYPGLDQVPTSPVYVSKGTNISLSLSFIYGTVRFVTEPTGAVVTVEGKPIGQTPYEYRRKPGRFAYHVELDYYKPEEGASDLAAGATIPVSLPLRPKDVRVMLWSNPTNAQYYLANIPINGTNDYYTLPWGTNVITARYPSLPGLPGLEPQTESINVDRDGKTEDKFVFSYATLEITNAESDAMLLYQGKPVTSLPASIYLKPDFQYDFAVEYGSDYRTNLPPVNLAAYKSFRPFITLPELRKTYTNSIGMVLIHASKDLYAGKFEVTEQEYRRIMGGALQGKPLQPVVNVNLTNAQKFCEALTSSGDEQKLLTRQKLAGWKYSVPTEVEWKSFAAPSAAVLDGSLLGRLDLQSPPEIDPNRKSASQLGIYDLFGSAAEWCFGADLLPITMGGSVANRKPKPTEDAVAKLRAGNLLPDAVANGSPTIGFRCVLKRPPQ